VAGSTVLRLPRKQHDMQYSTHLLRQMRLIIGHNIHRFRFQKELSLPDLAHLSGVSERRLKQYELGKHKIDLDNLFRIASVLCVHIREFMDESGDGSL